MTVPFNVEGVEQVFYTVLPLSYGLVFLYLVALLFVVWRAPGLLDPTRSRREMILAGVLLAVGLAGLALSRWLAPDLAEVARHYVRQLLLHGSRRPLEFLTAHTLYLGPVFLLAVCFASRLSGAVSRLGWGMALAILLMGYQAINPLTRQCIIILPFLGLLTALAMEDARLGKGGLVFLALFSLLLSKVWYRINYNVDTSISGDQNPVFWPRFVESTGYYMKTPDYMVQGAFLLFCLVGLFLYFRTLPQAPDAGPAQGERRAP